MDKLFYGGESQESIHTGQALISFTSPEPVISLAQNPHKPHKRIWMHADKVGGSSTHFAGLIECRLNGNGVVNFPWRQTDTGYSPSGVVWISFVHSFLQTFPTNIYDHGPVENVLSVRTLFSGGSIYTSGSCNIFCACDEIVISIVDAPTGIGPGFNRANISFYVAESEHRHKF